MCQIQQIFVSNEVESWEGGSLSFKIFAKSLLDLSKKVRKSFKASLDALDIEDVNHHGALRDFLHQGEEFRGDRHKPRGLDWEQGLDVSRPTEDPLQVDPASLHINPDVEESVDPVQLILPGDRLLLKHLVIRRELHRGHLVDILL